VSVAGEALADHRSGQNIERGEQGGGAVALVAPTSAQQALGRPGRYADAPEKVLAAWDDHRRIVGITLAVVVMLLSPMQEKEAGWPD
jgi:hypothetical protein